jgi:hypothetical protein
MEGAYCIAKEVGQAIDWWARGFPSANGMVPVFGLIDFSTMEVAKGFGAKVVCCGKVCWEPGRDWVFFRRGQCNTFGELEFVLSAIGF